MRMRIDKAGAVSGTYDNVIRLGRTFADGLTGRLQSGGARTATSGRSHSTAASAIGAEHGVLSDSLPGDPLLDGLVESINDNLQSVDKRLQFLVHEGSGRMQVRVIDRNTDEVIREVPPEKLLDLVERIHDLIGLLVDETV